MKDFDATLTFSNFIASPGNKAINSTGAGTQDGTEMIAEQWNNMCWGPIQAVMAWAAGGTNTSLSGTPGVFDGNIDEAAASQFLEAIQKGNGIGPGMYVQRAIEDSVATYGDRAILLAGQGVLVATYPDLNTACWIGGNDAAQQAAKDAGGKFWRADDAIGTNALAAGDYLMLPDENPTYQKQYTGVTGAPGIGEFQVSGSPAIISLIRAIAIPYQTSDGTWRLRFNCAYTVASASRTIATFIISGVTFKNVSSFIQPVSTRSISGLRTTGNVTDNTSNVVISHVSTATTSYMASGDVELDSKPTWADDFTYDWYITY